MTDAALGARIFGWTRRWGLVALRLAGVAREWWMGPSFPVSGLHGWVTVFFLLSAPARVFLPVLAWVLFADALSMAFPRAGNPWLGPLGMSLVSVLAAGTRPGFGASGPRDAFLRRHALLFQGFFAAAAVMALVPLLVRDAPIIAPLGWFCAWAAALLAAPKPESGAWRRQAPALALLTLSALLFAGLMEAGSRAVASLRLPAASHFFMPDARAGFTLRPGFEGVHARRKEDGSFVQIPTAISAQGLRDRVYGPRQPDEFRIVMLGDSYTFGWGVEAGQSIPKALERRLNAAGLPVRVSVVNGGVGAYGPWQEYFFLQDRCMPLQPCAVIHELFPGNDIDNTLVPICEFPQAYYAEGAEAYWRWKNSASWPSRTEQALRDHVSLYRLLLFVTGRGELAGPLLGRVRFFQQEGCAFPVNAARPYNLEICLKDWYPTLEKGWRMFEGDVLKTRQSCLQHGIDYVAYCVPEPCQVIEDRWKWATHDLGPGAYERFKDVRKCQEFFDREGIPNIPLRETVIDAPDREELYFVHGHFTPKGSERVAERIAEYVINRYFSGSAPRALCPE